MKVLQVNCVYNKGSTGKIVADIDARLKEKGIESVVCYGRGQMVKKDGVYKTCSELYAKMNNLFSRITGIMYGGCFFSTNKLIRVIKKEKPDIVHLHCINGYFVNIYRLVAWLNKNGIKTVLTLHAEFMHTANCAHAFECEKWKSGCGACPRFKRETKSLVFDRTKTSFSRMKKAFDGFEVNLTVVSVSPWLMERAKQSPIMSDKKHTVVLNGLDTDVFKVYDSSDLRREISPNGEKIIFHATPHFSADPEHPKGGYYVLKLASMLKEKGVRFLVAGSYDATLSVPDNVTLLGKVSDQKCLAKYYSLADFTVLTSKRETFSMVVAESLSAGTPVVGFEAGGPEQIALGEYSSFVKQGDVEGLREAALCLLDAKFDKNAICQTAHLKYDKNHMADEYIKIYKEMLREK